MNYSLTPRRRQVLTFIRDYVDRHQMGPTLAEISGALQVGKVTVLEHLHRLMKDRLLEGRQRYAHRALRLTELGRRAVEPPKCPHCGKSIETEDSK